MSILLTAEMLKKIAPNSKRSNYKFIDQLVMEFNQQLRIAGIDTKPEIWHFIAQAAHETDSFNTLQEYASGEAYELRKDLGNIVKGWGVKFKGRGIFQTTGYTNYKRLTDICPDKISFISKPELLETPKYAVWSAITFWNERHLSDVAIIADSERVYSKKLGLISPIQYITLRINGGQNGLAQRKRFYERCKGNI